MKPSLRTRVLWTLLPLWTLVACGATGERRGPDQRPVLTLVESVPRGTDLGHDDLPDTAEVWVDLIGGAERTLELAHFYAVDEPPSLLSGVVRALEDAVERGVAVRLLLAEGFRETYPELPARLDALPGFEVRFLDLEPVTDGILHAKFLVADDADVFVGSANLDWRSLDEIQELGVRVRSAALAASVLDVFEHDWALAGGEAPPAPTGGFPVVRTHLDPAQMEVAVRHAVDVSDRGGEMRVFDDGVLVVPAVSPQGLLPTPATWDLPQILAMIDGAREEVLLQAMTIRVARRGRRFAEFFDALEAAAARGVEVRVLTADWSKRGGTVEGLQDLQRQPGLDVRFVVIPRDPARHVPYGRVAHSKFLVVDRERAWIGSSNIEHGYFHQSRNLGLVFEGAAIGQRLGLLFDEVWDSPLAEPVDPDAEYVAPRID